jgi:hypothetical protein
MLRRTVSVLKIHNNKRDAKVNTSELGNGGQSVKTLFTFSNRNNLPNNLFLNIVLDFESPCIYSIYLFIFMRPRFNGLSGTLELKASI